MILGPSMAGSVTECDAAILSLSVAKRTWRGHFSDDHYIIGGGAARFTK